MSAWIVDREHIAYFIDCALNLGRRHGTFVWYHDDQGHELTEENASQVGQMLWDENIASVAYRYEGEDESPAKLPGPVGENYKYKHELAWAFLDPVQLIKSCDCYEYQSCEHEGWKKSSAKAFIDVLRDCACGHLKGYDEAEWGPPKQKPMRIVKRVNSVLTVVRSEP